MTADVSSAPLTARNATRADLAALLRDQQARKVDVVAPAPAIRAEDGWLVLDGTSPDLGEDGVTLTAGRYRPTDVCDQGIADKLGIPAAYLRRMRESCPGLYDANVNGWPRRRRVRGGTGQPYRPARLHGARQQPADAAAAVDRGLLRSGAAAMPTHARRLPVPGRGRGTAYALAALREETRRVATARPGTRNDTLNRAGFSLGQLVAAGLLPPAAVIAALASAAGRAGLPEDEARRTICSGMAAGARKPRGSVGAR